MEKDDYKTACDRWRALKDKENPTDDELAEMDGLADAMDAMMDAKTAFR